MATSSGNDLFNFRLFQDDKGIHLLLSGALAKDFETLMETCKKHCTALACCHGFGGKSDDASAA